MPSSPAERTLPTDLEAEQSVLGAILLDPDALSKIPFLRPGDFYREANGNVLRAAQQLFARHEPIDNVTLGHELQSMGELERIGGRTGLAMLQEAVPTAANVLHYAEIVRDKAILRRGIAAATELVAKGYENDAEPASYVGSFQSVALNLADLGAHEEPAQMDDLVREFVETMESPEKADRDLPSGFRTLDRYLNGMGPGDFIIIAGRASMGKTALGMNVALRVAKKGYPVAVFSLEMTRQQLVDRLVAQEARVDAQRVAAARKGKLQLTPNQRERVMRAVGPLAEAPIFIDDSGSIDELTLASKARQLAVKEHGLRLVVVDYIQLLEASRNFKDNRVAEVSYLSRFLKKLARDLQVPILALSQLNRAADHREKDKRPRLSDLRESGGLEQDADVVIGAYRDAYYNPPTEAVGVEPAEAIFLKNRNGDTGTAKLAFNKGQTRFDDFDEIHEDPAPRYNPGGNE